MTAAELRAAADRLDALADASQPVDLTWFEADDGDLAAVMGREDRAYVAAMHPNVARGFASVLRALARVMPIGDDGEPLILAGSTYEHALSTARAINGNPP